MHTLEYYLTIKKNKVLIYGTTWMELVKEDRYKKPHPIHMISLIWDVQSRQIRRQICGCLDGFSSKKKTTEKLWFFP